MAALRQGVRHGSARELAPRLGVSERTIRNYLAEPRASYQARAAERHARIRELREQGLSMRQIADQLGISVGTVHYALHRPTTGAEDTALSA